MPIEIEKFARKSFYVRAIQVTDENMEKIADWCKGKVSTEEHLNSSKGRTIIDKYIKVHVLNARNEGQSKAYVSNWVTYTSGSFKVYTNKAFINSFEKVEGTKNVFEEAALHEQLDDVDGAEDTQELLVTDETDPGIKLLKDIFEQPAVNGIENDAAAQAEKSQPV